MQIKVKEIPAEYILNDDWLFECSHQNTHVEEVENVYWVGDSDQSYNSHIVVCDNCNEEIENGLEDGGYCE